MTAYRLLFAVAVLLALAGCTRAQWASWAPPAWLDADGNVIPASLRQPRDHRSSVEIYRPDLWNRMMHPDAPR